MTMPKLDKTCLRSKPPAWFKEADRALWSHYDRRGEPPLKEVLDDPIVKALAMSDQVSDAEIDKLVRLIRGTRAVE